ncbi:OmpA family protein [Kribbella qitaiheensis]|uniref:OmpA family protein n=1 Tax=Kribbella qitaiheensis TaxID=1544730 RepID=UPI003617C3EB
MHRHLVVAWLALAATLGLTLSGCTPPEQTGATALVIGNRQNMPRPALLQTAADALSKAIKRGDRLVVIAVSGEPQIVAKSDLRCPYDNKPSCAKYTKDKLAAIPGVVAKYPATATESSLLAAINLARDNIANTTGPKQIITIDSGIDTVAPMPLTDLSVLAADQPTIAKGLANNGFSPNLSGISVLMTGLGQTMSPQPKLTSPEIARLQTLWTAVLDAAHVDNVEIDPAALPQGTRDATLPRVTPAKQPPPPETEDPCKEFSFNESDLGFEPDRATFRDHARAKAALSGIARVLVKTGLNVVLTGTTAYRETNPDNPLSNARATAAKNILVELGVPAKRILTQGVGIAWHGYRDPGHNPVDEIKMRLVLVRPTCP